MSMKPKKQATLSHALIPIVFLIGILSLSIIKFGADPHIPLIFAIIVAALVAVASQNKLQILST